MHGYTHYHPCYHGYVCVFIQTLRYHIFTFKNEFKSKLMRYIVTNKYYDVFEKKKKKKKQTKIMPGAAPWGGGARGAKAPLKISKKGKIKNMGYFHASKLSKLAFLSSLTRK